MLEKGSQRDVRVARVCTKWNPTSSPLWWDFLRRPLWWHSSEKFHALHWWVTCVQWNLSCDLFWWHFPPYHQVSSLACHALLSWLCVAARMALHCTSCPISVTFHCVAGCWPAAGSKDHRPCLCFTLTMATTTELNLSWVFFGRSHCPAEKYVSVWLCQKKTGRWTNIDKVQMRNAVVWSCFQSKPLPFSLRVAARSDNGDQVCQKMALRINMKTFASDR